MRLEHHVIKRNRCLFFFSYQSCRIDCFGELVYVCIHDVCVCSFSGKVKMDMIGGIHHPTSVVRVGTALVRATSMRMVIMIHKNGRFAHQVNTTDVTVSIVHMTDRFVLYHALHPLHTTHST